MVPYFDSGHLIELVRQNPALYNYNDEKYGDHKFRDMVWMNIGNTLEQPGYICKEKWVNLRDCYKRSIRTKQRRIEQGLLPGKSWRWENKMTFLLPFFADMNMKEDDLEPKTEESNGIINWEEEKNQVEDVQSMIKVEMNDEEESADVSPPTEISTETPTPIRRARGLKRKRVENNSATSILMKYLLQKHEVPRSEDALSHFFASICATVQSFDSYRQHLAKSRIFNIISELELEVLLGCSTQPNRN